MIKTIYPYNSFYADVQLLAHRIQSNRKFNPDFIIGINRGGCIPAVYISHMLGIPCEMVTWQTRDGGIQRSIPAAVPKNCKNVLIVDDINDSGLTFKQIYKTIKGVNVQYKTAVLLQRYSSTFDADYYSELVEDDNWIVFPWE